MNDNILCDAICAITKSWYLDVKFLIETVETHALDFNDIVESVEMNFWKEFSSSINHLIYEALYQVAYKFIESHEELFEYESNEFEIYTNYLDSHIYFNSETVQTEFEKFY